MEREKERKKRIDKIRQMELDKEKLENESIERENPDVITQVEKINLYDDKDIDESLIEEYILLQAFKNFNVKVFLIQGDSSLLLKKKKYHNFFDYILIGFHSKNIFKDVHVLGKPNFKLLVELNSFMTTFDKEAKDAYKEKLKEKTEESFFYIDDTSSDYIWKFIHKPPSEITN